jgi:hypothetical protein
MSLFIRCARGILGLVSVCVDRTVVDRFGLLDRLHPVQLRLLAALGFGRIASSAVGAPLAGFDDLRPLRQWQHGPVIWPYLLRLGERRRWRMRSRNARPRSSAPSSRGSAGAGDVTFRRRAEAASPRQA